MSTSSPVLSSRRSWTRKLRPRVGGVSNGSTHCTTDGEPMKIAYLVETGRFNGSRYKYTRIMQDRFGGKVFIGRPASLKRKVVQYNPKLMVVFGDKSKTYQIAKRLSKRYVVIENDVATMRGQELKREKEMLEGASAVLFTSEHHQDYCNEMYDIRYSCVVNLRPLARDLRFKPLQKLGERELVYSGGIQHPSRNDSHIGYRSYTDVFGKLIEDGWNVHVYPGNIHDADTYEHYHELGCIMHRKVSQDKLYRELSQYNAGLQVFADTDNKSADAYAKSAYPNKLWEYLAAGIPMIGYNVGQASYDVYHGKWGRVYEDLSEINLSELPEVDDALRYSQVMDSDVLVLDNLIREAMK